MSQDYSYNYPGYDPGDREEEDFARFQEVLRVGQKAPDFEVTRLEDGEKVTLSDLTTRSHVILEFGSFT